MQTKPTLVALTQDSLLFYDSVPQSTDEWLQSSHFYSLLTTRLVVQANSSNTGANSSTINSRINFSNNLFDFPNSSSSVFSTSSPPQSSTLNEFYFMTRHGTTRGIQSHLFKCKTKNDFTTWVQSIEKQTHTAVCLIKHVDFRKSSCLSSFYK